MSACKLVRFEKGARYYVLYLTQDLLSDWVVVRVNGRSNTQLGKIRQEVYATYAKALTRFNALSKYRTRSRGYHVVTS